MSLSRGTIEELAPDQSSLAAARKLLAAKKWPTTARNGDESLIWGDCQGSGSTPYRVVYAPPDRGYKCSCPSRKFPCKHVLALMWLRVDDAAPFDVAEVPEWITDWLGRRRKPTTDKPEPAAGSRASVSLESAAAAPAERERKVDPARAAAQRERNRQRREAQVRAGLDELDTWLDDQLGRGLAGFAAVANEQARVISRRLADAKAPGLASRVDQLSSQLFGVPEAERGAFLAEQFGALHLLAEAYRRQDTLPDGLRADVRQLVGWSIERQQVLEAADGRRATGTWTVVARTDEVQPDRLRRIETWLLRADERERDVAVLVDHVPVSGGNTGALYTVGETIAATLAFYLSSVPLRALIAERHDGDGAAPPAWPQRSFADELALLDAQRAAHPWFDRWPLVATDLRVVQTDGGGLWLVDAAGTLGAPLHEHQDAAALPLVGVAPFAGFAVCDRRGAELHFARTAAGEWRAS